MSRDYFPPRSQYIKQFDRYITLRENWDFSLSFARRLSDRLAGRLSDNVETVALAGSFGRLEGSPSSDADYILLVKEERLDPETDPDAAVIRAAIQELGVEPPNKTGVFAQPRSVRKLLEATGHHADETPDMLGKRMLLLLESRPVFDVARYEAVLDEVFGKYAGDVRRDPTKEFVFLLNDLIRYFRYICVNYQETFWRQNEKWPIRNLKLRHSRILMYAGLLCLLGEASKYEDQRKLTTIREYLHLTPLERLAFTYAENHDHGFFKVAGLYNVFLARLSEPETREALNAIDYADRYQSRTFAELKANSDAFVSELNRSVWSRQGVWSDRFFEYLIF
ncbi:MAG TPA: hypothetical protein VHG28_02050 [Longimicrobiaceae bacterium]|nr:hypothetical protein [Longimicrobiaceae bacterium]